MRTSVDLVTGRQGTMTDKCESCKKMGGRHRLGCPMFKAKQFKHEQEPRFNQIAQDGGDKLEATFF